MKVINSRVFTGITAVVFAVSLVGGVSVSSAQAATTDTESSTVTVTVESYVSITAAADATITTDTAATTTGNVTVATNKTAGYTLSVKGNASDSGNEASLKGQTAATEFITPGASSDLTAANLSAGTWGLGSAAATNAAFANKLGALTDTNQTFKATSAAAPLPTGDATTVTYGANVEGKTAQTYVGSVLWTAVTNN